MVITRETFAGNRYRVSQGWSRDSVASAVRNWPQSAHRNKSRRRPYPLYPRPNLRKIVEGKSAFVGDVGVGEQGDVGDAVVFGEEILLREVLLHVTADGRVGEDTVHLPAVIKQDTVRKASFSSV